MVGDEAFPDHPDPSEQEIKKIQAELEDQLVIAKEKSLASLAKLQKAQNSIVGRIAPSTTNKKQGVHNKNQDQVTLITRKIETLKNYSHLKSKIEIAKKIAEKLQQKS